MEPLGSLGNISFITSSLVAGFLEKATIKELLLELDTKPERIFMVRSITDFGRVSNTFLKKVEPCERIELSSRHYEWHIIPLY